MKSGAADSIHTYKEANSFDLSSISLVEIKVTGHSPAGSLC